MKLWIFVFVLDTVCSSSTTITPPTEHEEDCLINECQTLVPLVIFGCFVSTAMVWVWVCEQYT